MQCPVCNNRSKTTTILPAANAAATSLHRCRECGSNWAVNHGKVELMQVPAGNAPYAPLDLQVEALDRCA